MRFQSYRPADYFAVCDFLTTLNAPDQAHINWNWARFAWMMEHPDFDKSREDTFGLWLEGGSVVAAAIYDMYFGEAFCGALPGYEALYPELLDYAWRTLRDEAGLGVSIWDESGPEIAAAERAGFVRAEQQETVLSLTLDRTLPTALPAGLTLRELDPVEDFSLLQWTLWQGFDHGDDRAQCLREDRSRPVRRPQFRRSLSLGAVDGDGACAACCCLWYDGRTDYAYIEPVCTVPAWRGQGVARALLSEGMNRARALGARQAFVISDQIFYRRLGFEPFRRFPFFWKTQT